MALTTLERVTQLLRLREPLRLFPPREGAAFWERGHPRNLAVGCQKLYSSNKHWKERYGYNRHSLSETAMYRVKQLLEGRIWTPLVLQGNE